MKKLNLVGETYGRLTVIEEAEPHIRPSGQKARRWICECECGNETIVRQAALRSGRTKSCGCLHRSPKERFTDLTGRKATSKNAREYLSSESRKVLNFDLMCDELSVIFGGLPDVYTEEGRASQEDAKAWMYRLSSRQAYYWFEDRTYKNAPADPWNFIKPETWQTVVDLIEEWLKAKPKLEEQHRVAKEIEQQARNQRGQSHEGTEGQSPEEETGWKRVTYEEVNHPDLHQDIDTTSIISYLNHLFYEI